jgi:hypothetical protein
MKARLTEQYDVTVTKREMGELMLALRTFCREFDASPLAEELLDGFEEVYQGGGEGIGIGLPVEAPDPDPEDDEGGSPVVVEK